jgi:hypothetical protein
MERVNVCLFIYLFIYLFAVYLTTLFQSLRLYSVEWKGGNWMMNWKDLGGSGHGRGVTLTTHPIYYRGQ